MRKMTRRFPVCNREDNEIAPGSLIANITVTAESHSLPPRSLANASGRKLFFAVGSLCKAERGQSFTYDWETGSMSIFYS